MKAVFIIGASGAGKTTLARSLREVYTQLFGDCVVSVNLDCANETPEADIDVGELIKLEDVMEQFEIGPNAALLYSVDFLWENVQWLLNRIEEAVVGKDPSFRLAKKEKVREALGMGNKVGVGEGGNVIVLIDLPGQAELYLNHPSLKLVVNSICDLGLTPCLLELYDCTYLYQVQDFVSVCMMTLTSMLNLDMPHLSLLSKIDLMAGRRPPDGMLDDYLTLSSLQRLLADLGQSPQTGVLQAIAEVIDKQSRVQFLPISVEKPELVLNLVLQIQKMVGSMESNMMGSPAFAKAMQPLLEDFGKEKLMSNLDVELFKEEEEIDFAAELLMIQKQRNNK